MFSKFIRPSLRSVSGVKRITTRFAFFSTNAKEEEDIFEGLEHDEEDFGPMLKTISPKTAESLLALSFQDPEGGLGALQLMIQQLEDANLDLDRSHYFTMMKFGEAHTKMGNLEVAENALLDANRMMTAMDQTDSIDFCHWMVLQGDHFLASEKFNDALKMYQDACEAIKRVDGDEGFDYAKAEGSVGRCHLALNQLDNADEHIASAIALMERLNTPSGNYDYCMLLEHGARLDLMMNRSQAALDKMRVYLPEVERLAADPTMERARTYMSMGEIFLGNGEATEALEAFEKAIADIEGLEEISDDLYGSCIFAAASCKHIMQDTVGASELLKNAMENVKKNGGGMDSVSYAVMELMMFDCFIAEQNFMGAKSAIDHALKTLKGAPEHAESRYMASALLQAGKMHLMMGQVAEGKSQLEESLEITEKIFGPDHAQVGLVLDALADASLQTGDMNGARELLNRAIPIIRNGQDGKYLALSLRRYGTVLLQMNDPAAAAPILDECVSAMEINFGETMELASVYGLSARCDLMQNQPGAALPKFERSVGLFEAAEGFGSDHVQTLLSRAEMSTCYLMQGDDMKARVELESVLPSLEEQIGLENDDLIRFHGILTQVDLRQGRMPQARSRIQTVINKLVEQHGEEDRLANLYRWHLAEIEFADGNREGALELFSLAVENLKIVLGEQNPDVQMMGQRLEYLKAGMM